jgi:hypothetical protein
MDFAQQYKRLLEKVVLIDADQDNHSSRRSNFN